MLHTYRFLTDPGTFIPFHKKGEDHTRGQKAQPRILGLHILGVLEPVLGALKHCQNLDMFSSFSVRISISTITFGNMLIQSGKEPS